MSEEVDNGGLAEARRLAQLSEREQALRELDEQLQRRVAEVEQREESATESADVIAQQAAGIEEANARLRLAMTSAQRSIDEMRELWRTEEALKIQARELAEGLKGELERTRESMKAGTVRHQTVMESFQREEDALRKVRDMKDEVERIRTGAVLAIQARDESHAEEKRKWKEREEVLSKRASQYKLEELRWKTTATDRLKKIEVLREQLLGAKDKLRRAEDVFQRQNEELMRYRRGSR